MASQTWVLDADSFMDDSNIEVNYGSQNMVSNLYYLSGGKVDQLQRSIGIVDFSGVIPSGSTINWAKFWQVYKSGIANSAAYYRYHRCIHPLIDDWIEDEVCWLRRKDDVNWGVAGGDYSVTVGQLSEIFQHPYYLYGGTYPWEWWFDVDIKEMVEYAILNCSSIWSAICVRNAGNVNNDWQAWSLEEDYAGYDLRPYIEIDWTPPGGANILKISGVTWANVDDVSGVAEASISKVSGVTAN